MNIPGLEEESIIIDVKNLFTLENLKKETIVPQLKT